MFAASQTQVKPMHGRYNIVMSADSKTAKLEIIGDISWWENGSREFTRKLKQLATDGVKTLYCYINSGGGSVFDANEIVNQLRAFAGKKEMCQIGAICASAATLIAMEFEEVEMAENGMFMIHEPSISVYGATEKKLESWRSALEQMKVAMVKAYSKRTGLAEQEIRTMMDVETWMNAEKAKKFKFIDKIGGQSEDDEELDMQSSITAYGYRHMPIMHTSIPSKMKTVIATLGLNEGATESDVVAKVKELLAEKDAFVKSRAEQLVDNAIANKVIALSEKDQYVKDAVANYDLVARLLNGMTAPKQITAQIQLPTGGTTPKAGNDFEAFMSKADKSFDDLTANMTLLEEVRTKRPDVYASLYKSKFGMDCKIED